MTTTRLVRVGTRGSALARTQTNLIADALGVPTEIVPIVTAGDRSAAPMEQIGGTGVFVSALRDALQRNEIDIAVHSYKDLPTAPENSKNVLVNDPQFWGDKGEELRQRFTAWLAQ